MSHREERKLKDAVHLIDLAARNLEKRREKESSRSAALHYSTTLCRRALLSWKQCISHPGGSVSLPGLSAPHDSNEGLGTPIRGDTASDSLRMDPSAESFGRRAQTPSPGPGQTASMRGESVLLSSSSHASSSDSDSECTSELRPGPSARRGWTAVRVGLGLTDREPGAGGRPFYTVRHTPVPLQGLDGLQATPAPPSHPPAPAPSPLDSTPLAQEQKDRLIERLSKVRDTRTRVRTRGNKQVLRREGLVDQVLNVFRGKETAEDLLAPLAVAFEGEDGVDAGGVTTELYSQFFNEALAPSAGIFALSGTEGAAVLPLPAAALPPHRTPADFRALGRAMARACLDFSPLPRCLASALFKALLGLDKWPLRPADLEEYDPPAARSLRLLLHCTSDAELAALCIYDDESDSDEDSSDLSQVEQDTDSRSSAAVGLASAPSPTPLKLHDLPRFVDRQLRRALLRGREEPLRQLQLGFADLAPVWTELRVLTPKGLREALCGKLEITAEDIRGILSLEEALKKDRGRVACGFLLEMIAEWPEARLREFLRLLTGLSSLPIGGLNNRDASPSDRIRVLPCLCTSCKRGTVCAQLPTVSTCFYTMRLPGAGTRAELERRMVLAIEFGGRGFGAV